MESKLRSSSRFVVVQAIGAAALIGLWMAGPSAKPFEGSNAPLCWLDRRHGALGVACVFLRRWQDVQWIATHVVRIGLLGTVIGLHHRASRPPGNGASADAEQVKTMIAAVVSGTYVSLYATLLGIATNLWLEDQPCACWAISMDEETLTVWLDTALLMLGGFILMTVLMRVAREPAGEVGADGGRTGAGQRHHRGAVGRLARCRRGPLGQGARRQASRLFQQERRRLQSAAGRPRPGPGHHRQQLRGGATAGGIPAGEYIANVHMYRGIHVAYPVTVKVVGA